MWSLEGVTEEIIDFQRLINPLNYCVINEALQLLHVWSYVSQQILCNKVLWRKKQSLKSLNR